MRGCAELTFDVEDSEKVYQALIPEADDDHHRSSVKLEEIDGSIRLKVEGDDVVSIRAALNTWIRLIKIAIEMVSI